MLQGNHLIRDELQIYKDYCNYIGSKKLIFKGIKNQTIFFYSEIQKQLACIKMFTKNGQMKIFKKRSVKYGGITFMNTTNSFINSNLQYYSLWKFDDTQNWHYSRTIYTQELNKINYHDVYGDKVDTSQFLGLSKQDDQIVASDFHKICFIKKDKNGDWKCTQIMDPGLPHLKNFKFNEKGNILIAFDRYLIIFKNNTKNKMWTKTALTKFEDQYIPCCFIDNYQLFLYKKKSGFITKWKINAEAKDIQETKVQEIFDLQLIQSKVLQGSQNLFYLIKLSQEDFQIKQIFSVFKDIQGIYLLLFEQGNELINKQYKISLKRILYN